MILLVARVTLAELPRRRGALALVVVLPLAFYLVRLDTHWTALRLLSMGLGWAVATLALFSHVSGRAVDRRLVVSGASPLALYAGRQLAVAAVGAALTAPYVALVGLTIREDLRRFAPVALLLLLTVVVAVPLGALVAALVPRDLEGALLLLAIMAVQLLVDPAEEWTRVLPLWGTRELATYVVEPAGTEYLTRALAHGAATALILVLAAALVSVARLRVRAVPAVAPLAAG